MWYTIISVLVIFTLVFAGFVNYSAAKQNNNTCINQFKITKTFSKDEIKNKLLKLSKTPKPQNLSMGAMCYKVAMPPLRAEYICPACGNKTLYSDDYFNVDIVNHIAEFRSLVKGITELDIKLDESQFCKKCSPKVSSPELCLIINYDNKTKVHKVCDVSEDDIKILSEFLDGKNVHSTSNDAQKPLKDYLNRLQKLLGVPLAEINNKKDY